MSKFFVTQTQSFEKNPPAMEHQNSDETYQGTMKKKDRFSDHIVKIYSTFINLRDLIEQLDEFDLSHVEAQQEIPVLRNHFTGSDLVKLLDAVVGKREPKAAKQESPVFESCLTERNLVLSDIVRKKEEVPTVKYVNPPKPLKAVGNFGQFKETEKTREDISSNRIHGTWKGRRKTVEVSDIPIILEGEIQLFDQNIDRLTLQSGNKYHFPSETYFGGDYRTSTRNHRNIQASIQQAKGSNDKDPSLSNVPVMPDDHPRLLDHEKEQVTKIWVLGKSKTGSLKFTPEIYSSLKPDKLVVSEVVNGYNSMIVKRSRRVNQLPTVFAMEDYFLPVSMQFGFDATKDSFVDLESSMILFPMYSCEHWYSCIVDMRPFHQPDQKCPIVEVYDSTYWRNACYGERMKEVSFVTKFLSYNIMKRYHRPFEFKWKPVIMDSTPNQYNGFDCGMFMLKVNDYVSTDHAPNFNSQHIPYHRHRFVLELEEGNLSRILD